MARRLGRHEQGHALRVGLLEVLAPQVPAIQQMFFHLAARPLFYLFPHRGAQSRRVRTLVAHLHAHNRPARRVGGQLHIHRRVVSPVRHLHHPRFCIRCAHARFLLPNLLPALTLSGPPRRFLLPPLQFRQLRNRLLQPFLFLPRRPLPRRRLPRRDRRCRGGRRVQAPMQLLDVPLRFLQQLLQPRFPPKAARARPHPHPHSVLAHPAHLHHIPVHQRGHHLRQELVQGLPVVGAKIRQQAMVHAHAPAQPPKRRILLALPRR